MRRMKAWAAGVLVILFLGSGCGYVAAGAILLSGGSSGGGKKKAPAVPPVILLPDITRQVGAVSVDYTLQDANGDVVTVQVGYSTDSGTTFSPATIASTDEGTIVGDQIQGLTSSAAGVLHLLSWDAPGDLGAGAHTGIQIRLIPSDSGGAGSPVASNTFIAGNDAPVATSPTVLLESPGDPASGLVGVSYDLEDSTQDLSSILVEYRTSQDGVTWSALAPATVSVGSVTSLPAGLPGTPATHTFAWNSIADLSLDNFPHVEIHITPSDDFDTGSSVATASFEVRNNDSPSVFFEPINRQKGTIRISFVVADPQEDDVDVDFFFSLTDPGAGTGSDATIVAASGTVVAPNTVTGLASSEGSNLHWIDWDASTDIGTSARPTVWFQAIPSDLAGTGATRTAGPFITGNDAPSVLAISRPATSSTQTGIVEIQFTLADSSSDPVDLTVEWDDGTGPFPAAITVGITQGAPTSPAGLVQTIAWNTLNDIGVDNRNVTITITPADDATTVPEIGTPFTSGTFTVANSTAPVAYLASPAGSQMVSGEVTITYLLFQPNNATLDITMEYSTDSVTFFTCTERIGPPSEGVTGLSSSPGGDPHVFVWNSRADIPGDASTVWLKVHPTDGSGAGSPHTMANPFLLNNNEEPTIFVGTPAGVQEGEIALGYDIVDVEGDPVDITVTFSTNGGGSFAPATDAGTGDGTTGLTSSGAGTPHVFSWDSIADVVAVGARNDSVMIRMVPADNPDPVLGQGPVAQTVTFSVDNTSPPQISGLANVGSTGSITLVFDLIDVESNIASVLVEFSTNGGVDYSPATLTTPASGTVSGSEMTGLATNPAGVGHNVAWDSDTDIGQTNLNGILIRVTPRDTKGGAAGTVTIDVQNNDPPVVIISDITGIQSGNVIVNYKLQDTNSDPLSVTVRFRAPVTPLPATEGAGSEGTSGLTSGPPGQEAGHIFVWDSSGANDLSTTYYNDVRIEITASDPFDAGTAVVSNFFTVDNSIDADLVLGQDSFFQGAVDGRGIFQAQGIGAALGQVFVCDAENNRVLILNSVPASDYQTADLVLGQDDFSLDVGWYGGAANGGMRKPWDAWSDGTALYVVDCWSDRVLVWNTIPTVNNQLPDLVLGQIDMSGTNPRPLGPDSLYQPTSVTGTATRLFVSDTVNNRVLVYNLPITVNGQAATVVLGQADFVSSDADRGTGVNSNTLDSPRGLHTDGSSLFVADANNNRVLIWNPLPAVNGEAADRVLGQPNFTSESGSTALDRMSGPHDVAGDAGHTYVVDRYNHRVLVWNTNLPASLSPATFVLGQANGTSSVSGTSATALNQPVAAVSTGSELLVVDQLGNRVKIHDPLPVAYNEAANAVYGQRDFSGSTENHGDINAGSFRRLSSIEAAGGSLFVADQENNRVLGWGILPDVNNKNADFVFGQAAFTTSSWGNDAASLRAPQGVAYDPGPPARLFVADYSNHRVVVYDAPFSVGQAGSRFIGQPDGISNSRDQGLPSPASNTLDYPSGVSWDGSYLWVSDQLNHRILRFPPAALVTNGNADMVVGQPNFASQTQNHGDGDGTRGMNQPRDVASAGSALLVADRSNHRIMIWTPLPDPGSPDPAASWVLGRTTFAVGGGGGGGPDRLLSPQGVDSDGTRIVVCDADNARVLIWDAFPTANGEAAHRILGQPTFYQSTPNNGGVTPRSLYLRAPIGYIGLSPALEGSHVWVPDCGNNRVLRFPIGP